MIKKPRLKGEVFAYKPTESLALWERWQPKADGEGNIHTLSPAIAGALPKGEPWISAS